MPTYLQVRSNGQITLPSATRRQIGLQEGDLLEVVVEPDGSLRLIPKVAIDRSQAYFWSEHWQAGEQDAEADLKARRFKDFDSIEAMLADLEE